MGNDAGCSRLCEKTPVIQTNPDDILVTEYIVPCQICNRQFKHQDLKEHIDLAHYATIREEHDGTLVVQCLLCAKLTPDLVQLGAHLAEKHPYADTKPEAKPEAKGEKKARVELQVVTENAKERKRTQCQLNRTKKENIVKLESEKDFQIIKQVEANRYEGAVNGVNYTVLKYSKEYRGADYYQQLMEAELIWFNVFKQPRECWYYYLDLEPGQKTILCKAFIFITP